MNLGLQKVAVKNTKCSGLVSSTHCIKMMMLVLAAANKANEAGKYKKTVITTDAGVMATGGPLCSVGDSDGNSI